MLGKEHGYLPTSRYGDRDSAVCRHAATGIEIRGGGFPFKLRDFWNSPSLCAKEYRSGLGDQFGGG